MNTAAITLKNATSNAPATISRMNGSMNRPNTSLNTNRRM